LRQATIQTHSTKEPNNPQPGTGKATIINNELNNMPMKMTEKEAKTAAIQGRLSGGAEGSEFFT
jgi:hypothetical protein